MSLSGKRLYCLVFLMCLSRGGASLEASHLKVERSVPRVVGGDVVDQLHLPAEPGEEGELRLYLEPFRTDTSFEVELHSPQGKTWSFPPSRPNSRGVVNLPVLGVGGDVARWGVWKLRVLDGAGLVKRWWLHLFPAVERHVEVCPTDVVSLPWRKDEERWSVADVDLTTPLDLFGDRVPRHPALKVAPSFPESTRPVLQIVMCRKPEDLASEWDVWLKRAAGDSTMWHRKIKLRASFERPEAPEVREDSPGRKLRWTAGDESRGCGRYRLEFLCSDAPGAPVVKQISTSDSELELSGEHLRFGRFWRVRCEDGCGTSPPSELRRVPKGTCPEQLSTIAAAVPKRAVPKKVAPKKAARPEEPVCWSRPLGPDSDGFDPCRDRSGDCVHEGGCRRLTDTESLVVPFSHADNIRCAFYGVEIERADGHERLTVGSHRVEAGALSGGFFRVSDAHFHGLSEQERKKAQQWSWNADCLDKARRLLQPDVASGSFLTGHMQCDEPPSR